MGDHRVTIDRLVFGPRDGEPFQANDGSAKFMAVFTDPEGREVTSMFTCSDKAGWTIRRLCARFGVDCADLNARGVTPIHFGEEAFATGLLVGKTGWIRITPGRDMKYPEVEPVKEEDVRKTAPSRAATAGPAAARTSPPPVDPNDPIPFAWLIAFPLVGLVARLMGF
jgi:hypothetical protein